MIEKIFTGGSICVHHYLALLVGTAISANVKNSTIFPPCDSGRGTTSGSTGNLKGLGSSIKDH